MKTKSSILYLINRRDDGRGPFGHVWRPVTVTKEDWIVYIRIQKTGSQTFWQTLQQSFDSNIWGRPRQVKYTSCDKTPISLLDKVPMVFVESVNAVFFVVINVFVLQKSNFVR